MASKTIFVCKNCGISQAKWTGKCLECNQWNTMQERNFDKTKAKALHGLAANKVQKISAVSYKKDDRIITGFSEFDRTLGGGLVVGSVVLIGGEPGIGKSTFILQVLANIHNTRDVLYVSGEESAEQIKNRAKRLAISSDILLFSENNLTNIITAIKETKASVVVIDSIQTIISEEITSSAGSVSQVRECTNILAQFAKQMNVTLLLIGHITKDGSLAGPKVLEHIVDCVLLFTGDSAGRYRIIRNSKNRFGAVNEISVFAMLTGGLREIKNPSRIFLSGTNKSATGCIVTVISEGTRSLLVEIQALANISNGVPKRVAVGLVQNRLILQLAILHRHCNIVTIDRDIFVSVVGGIKISETASDLAVILAIVSTIINKIIPNDFVVFGEVGLTGEIRPVYNALDRIKEAKKQGFRVAIIPKANQIKTKSLGMKIIAVEYLHQAITAIEGY